MSTTTHGATTDGATTDSAISTEDRDALRQSVADLLAKRSDSTAVRAAMRTPRRFDDALWRTLCDEIGVAALAVPEEFGGAGASFVETATVLEELGATLSPVPVFSTALATGALLLSGDTDACARLLPEIASGNRIASLCWAGATGWDNPGVSSEAGLLTGTAEFVIDGESADLLLVLAGAPSGVTLHVVDADADGIEVTALPTVDPTRPLARITFDDTAATAITAEGNVVARLRTLAWALLAAEQVGGADRALRLAVEHASSRTQFGRIIGSFQALKHRMADMYTLVESSRSLARAAIEAVVSDDPNAADLAAAAHVYCSESFATVAGEAIQIHGGIGITAEHDIGLYFKRAHGSAQLFGQPHDVVAEMVDALRG